MDAITEEAMTTGNIQYQDGAIRGPHEFMQQIGHDLCEQIKAGDDLGMSDYLGRYETARQAIYARVRDAYLQWAGAKSL